MNYSDFKDFAIKIVIKDNGLPEAEFLLLLNWALKDFARDLTLIDTTYYHEEQEETDYDVGTVVDLGEVLSFAGAVDEHNRQFPHAKRATKGYSLVCKYYEDATTHHTKAWLEEVSGRPADLLTSVYFIYNRKPATITAPTTSSTVIDCPIGVEYELALKIKYLYLLGREFYQEANQVRATYRQAMDDYWKKHRGNSLPPNMFRERKTSRWPMTPFR